MRPPEQRLQDNQLELLNFKHKYRVAKAHDAAAIEYHNVKMIARKKGKNVERGCLEKTIKTQKQRFGLGDDVKIDPEAI